MCEMNLKPSSLHSSPRWLRSRIPHRYSGCRACERSDLVSPPGAERFASFLLRQRERRACAKAFSRPTGAKATTAAASHARCTSLPAGALQSQTSCPPRWLLRSCAPVRAAYQQQQKQELLERAFASKLTRFSPERDCDLRMLGVLGVLGLFGTQTPNASPILQGRPDAWHHLRALKLRICIFSNAPSL